MSQIDPRDGLLHLRIVIPFHLSFSLFSPFLHTLRYLSRFLPPASAPRISSPSTPIPSFPFLSLGPLSFFRPFRLFFSPLLPVPSVLAIRSNTDPPIQWRRQGGRAEASPLWVDVQKLCNMCVLSLSWNFVSHDKYIARPSSKEPR